MISRWIRHSLAAALGLLVLTAATPPDSQPPLSGRTIVIDPGHGGRLDTGAVSRGGLKESTVNLMVGTRLADLLQQLGANVILTRTTDTTVGSDEGGEDLAARANFANEAQADLFLSIHHNDTMSAGDPRNDTQVYWKLEDPGPSQDFARLLLPRLAESLGMARQQLMAGNFAVLRHCRRPAILGEGAYMSNPVTAAQLTKPETWQREAEAYGAAIQAYFARGVPKFRELRWQTSPAGSERLASSVAAPSPVTSRMSIVLDPEGGSIDSTAMLVDNQPVPAQYDRTAGLLTWTSDRPLANGPHTIRATARNAAGNAAIAFNDSLMVDRPPMRIAASSVPMAWHPDAADTAIIRASVRDALDQPVADGTAVTVRWAGQTVTRTTVGGVIAVALPWPAKGRAPAEITAGPAKARLAFADAPSHTHLLLAISAGGAGSGASDVPAVAVSLDGRALPATDSPEFATYEASPGQHRLQVLARGYQPWEETVTLPEGRVTATPITLVPEYGGVLLGKRIMLDPFVSTTRPDLAAKTLAMATELRDRLAAAGADVVLSRTTGVGLSQDERCLAMGEAKVDLYVGLDLGGGEVVHYYTSARGSRVARFICQQLNGYSPDPEASYLVTHSPCTAVIVRARSAATDATDALFEAIRLFYGAS